MSIFKSGREAERLARRVEELEREKRELEAACERRLAESEARHRALYLASKLAAVRELAAGVAHEINDPLNGIINFAQLLKDDGVARTDEHRRMIDGIIDESERVAQIVRGLLTFARHDAHEARHVHVGDTISASLSLFGHQLKKDGIEVETDVAPELPPVLADGSRLRQVVINLISNAHHSLRARREGTKVLRVTARPGAGGESVRVEFYDTGIGIRREDLPRVFDPFFTTRRSEGGTGLGLSICHGIVRDCGGTITGESAEGEYARFTVELPAAAPREFEGGGA